MNYSLRTHHVRIETDRRSPRLSSVQGAATIRFLKSALAGFGYFVLLRQLTKKLHRYSMSVLQMMMSGCGRAL